MFTMPFRKQARAQGALLNATQQQLIKEKFEILRQASFGFTQDRLLPISRGGRAIVKSCGLSEIRRRPSSASSAARSALHPRNTRPRGRAERARRRRDTASGLPRLGAA